MTAVGAGRGEGVEGLSKKKKGLMDMNMDMDNSMVIAEGGYKGVKW